MIDVLVVGAGPTGLALAAQLAAFGTSFRIIDRALDRVAESRALAIQPRTLEALAGFGVSDELVAHGNTGVRVQLHLPHRTVTAPLFDAGLGDTPYPFLLFVSQAETERILGEHLAGRGVTIERGVELRGGTLVHLDGRHEPVDARFVVGCDGAHSEVRRAAGIPFAGYRYPPTFVLADLEVDGIEPGCAHVFMSGPGMLLFLPLGTPASWRVLAMRPGDRAAPADGPVALADVQHLVDEYASRRIRLRDPVWLSTFRLHNRGAVRYRAGTAFLAGDAAHIHSPVGAQGMNTGIQDALNLGWKLALVCAGIGDPALLDTYEPERIPVGRAVLRFTDQVFEIGTSSRPLARFVRTRLAPRFAPLALRMRLGRGAAFRTIAELTINYRRSPLSANGPGASRGGPRAGDRVPPAVDATAVPFGVPGFRLVQSPRGVLLVRPDGYVGYRGDPSGLRSYVDRWLPGA